MLDIKLTGTFLCTRAVANVLMEQGKPGSIVNVISVEAKISRENDIAYATASGALYTFTAKTGRALAPHGIRVNAVSPGTTDTARNDALYGFPRSDYWRERTSAIPLGRAGQPRRDGPLHHVALHQGRRIHRRPSHRDGRRASGLTP